MLKTVTDKWGALDVLVNNAGQSHKCVIIHTCHSMDSKDSYRAAYQSSLSMSCAWLVLIGRQSVHCAERPLP